MNASRIGSFLLVVALSVGLVYFDVKVLPAELDRRVSDPFPERARAIPLAMLLAPPRPSGEAEKSDAGHGAIIFKRAYEESGFQLTEPILNNLVKQPRLDPTMPLGYPSNERLFPKAPEIVPAVEFWKSIYADYTSKHVVIHDNRYLDRIYAVLDFTDIAGDIYSDEEARRFRQDREIEKIAEIDRILKRLDAIQGTVKKLSAQESKIWHMWSFLDDDPERFSKARDRLRSQTGLSDHFERALIKSGAYLSHMEDIFRGYYLPTELTRMVFVESMFNNRALSKTGAAGLWQFMPQTAKRLMKMNQWVDERLDPFIATHGAAQLLRLNHEILGTWPLAINAYNSGAGRLKQAVRKLGTEDIATIIWHFKNNSYGFASRNFYPSFLAALEIVDNYPQYFGQLQIEEPMTYEVIALPRRVSFHDIAGLLDLDVASLHDLNPAFLPSFFEEDIYLPAGAPIRVPLGEGNRVLVGIYNIKDISVEAPQETNEK